MLCGTIHLANCFKANLVSPCWLGLCIWHFPSLTNCHCGYLYCIYYITVPTMGANRKSQQHLFCAVLLPAGMFSVGVLGEVSSVSQKDVPVELTLKMTAEWLDWFHLVLDALKVNLEITAHVLRTVEGGTFEVHDNSPVRNHMLATMAHYCAILAVQCSLTVNFVSCSQRKCGTTGAHLQMVAAKVHNHTPAVGEIDARIVQIESPCLVYFEHYCLMIQTCRLYIVARHRDHLLDLYWLSSAEIHLSTLNITKSC